MRSSECRSVSFTYQFVCLFATSRENHWSALRENFTRGVSLYKEVAVKFGSDPDLNTDPGTFNGILTVLEPAAPYCATPGIFHPADVQ